MSDDFKKLELIFHKFYDEQGKLRKISSVTDSTGKKTYIMEQPRTKTPLKPECSLHVYEDISSFTHDYEQCKHCKHKKYK